jgi:hypothetical protein
MHSNDWDALLAGALTIPGTFNATRSRDSGTFTWGRWNTPTWSPERAFLTLGIHRIDFPDAFAERMAGFATYGGCIGLNPRAPMKPRTAAHEIAHVVLGHLEAGAGAARIPVEEFEADCVALVVAHETNQGAATEADCRFYIQHFVAMPCAGPMPRTWDRIKACADHILRAGAGRFVVTPEPAPLVVQDAQKFAAKIRLGSW